MAGIVFPKGSLSDSAQEPKATRAVRVPFAHGSAVCLFSGGLDSLVGAIDWLETRPMNLWSSSATTIRASEDRSMTKKPSSASFVKAIAPDFLRCWLESGRILADLEITMRSRSLLFIALGVFVAHSLGDDTPLLIPENGTMALNPPLTPSRRGSCSTRTAHPYYLKRLQQLLDGLGLKHRLENPLLGKTKGEVASECRNADLLKSAAMESVSCAKRGHTVTWTE